MNRVHLKPHSCFVIHIFLSLVGSTRSLLKSLRQWLSTGGQFCLPENIWPCLKTFFYYYSKASRERAGKHPTMHTTVFHNKESSGPNINNAEVENPSLKKKISHYFEKSNV